MTVANVVPAISFTANGSQTTFAFAFAVEDKANIQVSINDLVVDPSLYSFDSISNTITFITAPTASSIVLIIRNTDLERDITYTTYNNSLRPETLNFDIDRVWRVLQELGYADSVINAKIVQEIADRLAGDTTLQNNLNAEVAIRLAADIVLQTNINNEASTRYTADQYAIRFTDAPAIPLPTSGYRAGKFLAFDAGGQPVIASGTGADVGLRTDMAAPTGSTLIGHRGVTLSAELDAHFNATTLADVMSKTVTGGSLVINCYGDSMTYGQDTVSTTGDLQVGINGSSATRALYQYPEAMGAALTKAGFNVTVNNYGFPGDTSVQGKTRFPAAVACDIAFVMFGHNDAKDTGGNPATSPANFKAAMEFILRREQANGTFVILLTPPRLKQSNLTGSVVNRQRWMRVFESVTEQLAAQYSVPCISVDEIVGHRGAELYSDDIHFNKYGYNEWGWNLSAALIQRSSAPKHISHGTVIQAAGSTITGIQTLLSGKTVLAATPTVPLCISGYFAQDVIAQVYITYNSGIGGSQRAKITLGGGTRNNTVAKTRTVSVTAAPQKILNSDIIKQGYRTLFLEVASSTTIVYIDRVEFIRPVRAFTDTAYEFSKSSALVGISLPAASEINRWIMDDTLPLESDFILEVDLTTAPTAGNAAGVSLVSEFDEATGNPSRYITFNRFGTNGAFLRVATATNDDSIYISAFPAAPTTIKVIRTGNNVDFYANNVLLVSKTIAFTRLIPAIFRNNSEITVNRFTVK